MNKCKFEDIFKDLELINKIKNKLPFLFQIAEWECSRGNKVGMEVGSMRERILIALFIYKFGKENVKFNIPITKNEKDVIICNRSISIKTISNINLSGVKLIWTVDYKKVEEYIQNYKPLCDIFLVQINWNKNGGIYFIPLVVQEKIFNDLGSEFYFKLPKKGTNPRGVEFSANALKLICNSREVIKIPIFWEQKKLEYDIHKRWLDFWKQEN